MRNKLLLIALLLPALSVAQSLNSPNIAIGFLDQAESFMIEEDYETASVFYKKAAVIFEDLEMWKPYYSCLSSLAESCLLSDDYREAKKYAKEALWEGYKKLGTYDENSASAAHLLAEIYVQTEQFGKAEMVHKTGLGIHKSLFGEGHPSVGHSYHELGNFYLTQNQNDLALECYEKARDIHVANFGTNHLEVAKSLFAIGELQYLNRDIESAFQSHQEAFTIRVAFLGNTHINVLSSLVKILQTAQQKAAMSQDKSEALTHYLAADQILTKHFTGIDGAGTLGTRFNRAVTSFYGKAIETAYEQYIATNESGFCHQAFFFSEKCKWITNTNAFFHHCPLFQARAGSFAIAENLSNFQKKYLSPRLGLIEYFIVDSSCFIFTLSNTAIDVDKVTFSHSFLENIKAWKDELSSSPHKADQNLALAPTSKALNTAFNVYQKLVSPAFSRFPQEVKQLVMVPDPKLWGVPLGVTLVELPADKGLNYRELPYLLHEFNLTYIPAVNSILQESVAGQVHKVTVDSQISQPAKEQTNAVPVALQSMKGGNTGHSKTQETAFPDCQHQMLAFWPLPKKETAGLAAHFYGLNKKDHSPPSAIQQAKLAYLNDPETPENRFHPHYWAGVVAMGVPEPPGDNLGGTWKWIFALGILGLLGFRFFFKKK